MVSGSARSSNARSNRYNSGRIESSVLRSSMNRIFRGCFSVLHPRSGCGRANQPNHAGGVRSAGLEGRSSPKSAQASPRKVDRAAAYYHYTLAHMYEEQVTVYGRSELANKAMEEYRLAIEADPSSEFLTSAPRRALRQDRTHPRRRARSAGHPQARSQQSRSPQAAGPDLSAFARRLCPATATAPTTCSSWPSSSTNRSSRSSPTMWTITFCSAASTA